MIAEYVTCSDPRWQECLTRMAHDFYHLPEYAAFAAQQEGGRAAAFFAAEKEGTLLIPLLLREVPAGLGRPEWQDAASPYGYPSPLLHPSTTLRQLETFLQAFAECSREQGMVSAFFRFHPLLPLPLAPFGAYGAIVRHGATVCIDLTATPEELWRGTRENHRRGIASLTREGFEVRIDHWEDLPEFIAIYTATMKRVHASDFYFFQPAYFTGLQKTLGERLHLCTVLSPRGEVTAAGLFTAVNGIVQYHLGGTADDYLQQAPAKLMFHHVRNWAKERGFRLFHIGGGLGSRNDSLFHFKAGFSSQRAEFHTARLVLHAERYASLSARFRQQRAASGRLDEDFFPLYRG